VCAKGRLEKCIPVPLGRQRVRARRNVPLSSSFYLLAKWPPVPLGLQRVRVRMDVPKSFSLDRMGVIYYTYRCKG